MEIKLDLIIEDEFFLKYQVKKILLQLISNI